LAFQLARLHFLSLLQGDKAAVSHFMSHMDL
jgi:hypothetical protein